MASRRFKSKDVKGKSMRTTGITALSKTMNLIDFLYPEAVAVALFEEGLIIFEESQEEVPVASGRLRGSGIVFLQKLLGSYIIIIGYGTQYALKIHEDTSLDANRKKRAELELGNVKYKTKLSTSGKSKYLQDPFEAAVPGLEQRVAIRTKQAILKAKTTSSIRTVRGKSKGRGNK